MDFEGIKLVFEFVQVLGTVLFGLALWYIREQNKNDQKQDKAVAALSSLVQDLQRDVGELKSRQLPELRERIQDDLGVIKVDLTRLQATAVTLDQLHEMVNGIRVQTQHGYNKLQEQINEVKGGKSESRRT